MEAPMTATQRKITLPVFLVGVAVAAGGVATRATASRPHSAPVSGASASSLTLTEEQARAIGVKAYLYGYPLVTMEMTRRVMTNAAEDNGMHAPMGQFAKMRTYPTAAFHDVTAPNADTLYIVAWLDVSKEPYVLSTPDMKGRYFLLPMFDGYTEVFQAPGSRTTGTGPQKYAITGPGWKGALPAGVTQYKSPTDTVWILGRIYSSGTPEDEDEVHKLQDAMSLVPLGAYGKPFAPPQGQVDPKIDMTTSTRDQVDRMGTAEFFGMMADLMKTNPPAAADKPMVDTMARIGIVPGKSFDEGKLAPATKKGLDDVPREAQAELKQALESMPAENGWEVFQKAGNYGTDYKDRALIAAAGLGANRPKDAVYPTSIKDANGEPYDGAHRYVMNVPKGQMPPAQAFWSLTMYDDKFFFVPNPLNKYTVSSRTHFKENADGSVDIYLQKDSPGGDKEANWLPAPSGKFALMLRLYWPKETPPSILDGSWKPQAVKRVD
jgi:hypothetical protein